MSAYDNHLLNSDLDAFKNSGVIKDASLTFSGTVGAGAEQIQQTTITVENPDYAQILFDNSNKHSGRFKSMQIVAYTLVFESTNGSELGVDLTLRISGSQVTVHGRLFNPYSIPVALQSTTINFKYIPYEGTI